MTPGILLNKSVVLDATNPSFKKRSIYIELAKFYKIQIRLIHIATDFEQSKSRNSLRETSVPLIALYMYRKKSAVFHF